MAEILVARRLEVDFNPRRSQTVVVQVGRLVVDDARDLQLGKRRRDAGHLGVSRSSRHRLYQVPAVFVFLERGGVARFRLDAKLVYLVGVDGSKNLLLFRSGAFYRLFPGNEVNVGEQPPENDDESNGGPQSTHLSPPPPGVHARTEHETRDED